MHQFLPVCYHVLIWSWSPSQCIIVRCPPSSAPCLSTRIPAGCDHSCPAPLLSLDNRHEIMTLLNLANHVSRPDCHLEMASSSSGSSSSRSLCWCWSLYNFTGSLCYLLGFYRWLLHKLNLCRCSCSCFFYISPRLILIFLLLFLIRSLRVERDVRANSGYSHSCH